MKQRRSPLIVLLLLVGLVVAACGAPAGTTVATDDASDPAGDAAAGSAPAGEATEAAGEEPVVAEASEEVVPEGRTHIRWYVGLGTGPREDLQPTQRQVVEEFNQSQDEIWLSVEFIETEQATDVLNTQIAAGNAPDVVGPMGIQGRARFAGAWLDLAPLIEESSYDLSDFDPALVDFYNLENEGQLGIPFAVFPSYISYNKDLFDEAGLPYPPTTYGEPYVDANGEEKPWNWETLRELALQLTVDTEGNEATSSEFDPDNIVQFGYGVQFGGDLRARLTPFGAGSLVDETCQAQMPEHWREAVQWYQDAMWQDYFYPNGPYGNSTLLGEGNWFQTGNLAMAYTHLWYPTCCMGEFQANWGVAPVPANADGEITAKLHADTFGILEYSEHPEEAFQVLIYLLGEAAPTLTQLYGGMPARLSLQGDYFTQLDQNAPFAGQEINWDVVAAGLEYPDNPSHEEGLPNFLQAEDRYGEFANLLDNDRSIDVDAAMDELVADLQSIYADACE